jgi:hypothetical protein
MTTRPPPEFPGGQDDEPPDVRQAIIVTLVLLADLHRQLTDPDPDQDPDDDWAELLLRMGAVVAVLRRVRDHLDES